MPWSMWDTGWLSDTTCCESTRPVISDGVEVKLKIRSEKSLIRLRAHNTSENAEEYLEALWTFEEREKSIAKISRVAEQLGVAPPSVVEMLKKLKERGLVNYYPYSSVQLTESGRVIAKHVVRNHRLVELLMTQTLGLNVDESVACNIEHHMTEEFTNALYTLLGHPQKCPHGNRIPTGSCCKQMLSS